MKYRKSLPADLKDYFWGDLALAIWFLDYGWYDPQKKTVRFSCGEWTRSECAIMVECLKDNFNLDAVVYSMESSDSPIKTPHHKSLWVVPEENPSSSMLCRIFQKSGTFFKKTGS